MTAWPEKRRRCAPHLLVARVKTIRAQSHRPNCQNQYVLAGGQAQGRRWRIQAKRTTALMV